MTLSMLTRVHDGEDVEMPCDINIIPMTMIDIHKFNQQVRDPKWISKVKLIKKKSQLNFSLSSHVVEVITKFILNLIEVIVFMMCNIIAPFKKKRVSEEMLFNCIKIIIPKSQHSFISSGAKTVGGRKRQTRNTRPKQNVRTRRSTRRGRGR